jgi:hypothetical protein
VRFLGIARTAQFTLNNRSKMDVMLCNVCYKGLTPNDCKYIMESVIRGWGEEMKLCAWPDKQKSEHMDRYSNLFISSRTDKPFKQEEIKSIEKPDKSNFINTPFLQKKASEEIKNKKIKELKNEHHQ